MKQTYIVVAPVTPKGKFKACASREVHVVGVRLTTRAGADRLCSAIREAADIVFGPRDATVVPSKSSKEKHGARNNKK